MVIRSRYKNVFRRAYTLRTFFLTAVILFVAVSWQNVFAAVAKNYYVDASASAGGDGLSEATAWKTLAQVNAAMDTFQPGDHIRFKRGETFATGAGPDTSLKITASGLENNPIVFEAYGDPSTPLPIIDGSRELGAWVHHAGNIYKHALTESSRPRILFFSGEVLPAITTLQFADVPAILKKDAILMQKDGVYTTLWATSVDHVSNTVSGITGYDILTDKNVYARQLDENGVQTELVPHLGTPKIISTPDGLTEPGHWYWDSGQLYLYSVVSLVGSTIPVGYTVNGAVDCFGLGCVGNGITIAAQNAQAEYVVVKDIKVQRFNDYGIAINDSSNITVDGVEVYGCGETGIQLWNSNNNTIQNNTVGSTGSGISMWAHPGLCSSGAFCSSMNNEILNNTVSNCRGACIAMSSEYGWGDYDPDRVAGNLISGNTISNANTMSYDGAGVYTWYAGSNTIDSNIIRNCGSPVLASAGIEIDFSDRPMIIRNNTIEQNSTGGIVVSGAEHQITGNRLRNNGVSSWRGAQIGFFLAHKYASNCTVTGNIIETDQNQHFIFGNPGSTSGHIINNNVYRAQSRTLFNWNDWSDIWIDFETWKSHTGHDADSKFYFSPPLSTFSFMSAILVVLLGSNEAN